MGTRNEKKWRLVKINLKWNDSMNSLLCRILLLLLLIGLEREKSRAGGLGVPFSRLKEQYVEEDQLKSVSSFQEPSSSMRTKTTMPC